MRRNRRISKLETLGQALILLIIFSPCCFGTAIVFIFNSDQVTIGAESLQVDVDRATGDKHSASVCKINVEGNSVFTLAGNTKLDDFGQSIDFRLIAKQAIRDNPHSIFAQISSFDRQVRRAFASYSQLESLALARQPRRERAIGGIVTIAFAKLSAGRPQMFQVYYFRQNDGILDPVNCDSIKGPLIRCDDISLKGREDINGIKWYPQSFKDFSTASLKIIEREKIQPLSMEAIATQLIQYETNHFPDDFGGPISVISLNKNGLAWSGKGACQ